MTLHQFLFDRLWDRGVRHIYGIPGDFALNLFEALERDGRFALVRLSHEPAVGFAADGAARMTGGLGVCCVTYGAGGLNMVNPVACAYAEQSPLVVLSGGPGRAEKRAGLHVHHEVKTFESQLNVYSEVTEYSAILDDPRTAATHITRAIDVAMKAKRPVYLEIPRDMVTEAIDPPLPDARLEMPVDDGAVEEAVAEIAARVRGAARPVLIAGVEVHRFQLRDHIVRLAETLQLPVASSFLGRGAFPTRHPQFVGTYLGVVSPPELRAIVEESDCVLLVGERISDTSLGISANRLTERNLLIVVARDVFIGHHRYENVPIDRVVAGLESHPALVIPAGTWQVPTATPSAPESRSPDRRHLDDRVARHRRAERVRRGAPRGAARQRHRRLPVCQRGDPVQRDRGAGLLRHHGLCRPGGHRRADLDRPPAAGAHGRRRVPDDGPGNRACPRLRLQSGDRAGQQHTGGRCCRRSTRMRATTTPCRGPSRSWRNCGAAMATLRPTVGDLRRSLAEAWASPRFSIVEVPVARGDISPVLARFVQAFKERVYRPR